MSAQNNNTETTSKLMKLSFLNLGYLPRWLIFTIDVALVLLANLMAYAVVMNLPIGYYDAFSIPIRVLFIVVTQALFFFLFKNYAGIIRHSTLEDVFSILKSTFCTFITLTILNYLHFFITDKKIFLMPALVLTFLFSLLFLMLERIVVKLIYQMYVDNSSLISLQTIAIFGTTNEAISLAKALQEEKPKRYKIEAFIEENNKNGNKNLLGLPILSHNEKLFLELENLNVKTIILADKTLNSAAEMNVVDECLNNEIELLNLPDFTNLNNQKSISKNLKSLELNDLLNRKPIQLDQEHIAKAIKDKVVFVTGAAGSIGSEIARQLALYQPEKLILIDQAETPLHQLTLDLQEFKHLFHAVIADVKDKNQLENLFQIHQPSFVFHAAAYKHVPLMEENPNQAILTNVLGTKNLADLSVKYKVDRFVFVSTDKAVNPTNIMGASKRIAEKYVQSLSVYLDSMEESHTKFITTRFGNVLGSNGSVIPLFTKQIAQGGPITLTHQDIIRYFMTIPEACQLVLEAGIMGNGGEIFIFDMGKPVKIYDLAQKMIRLAGFIPNEDIKIEIIGLRPGEKLFEELLNDSAKTLPTHHQKIMIATDFSENYLLIAEAVNELKDIVIANETKNILDKVKEIVPEYSILT